MSTPEGVEFGVGYLSLTVSTRDLARDATRGLRGLNGPAARAGREMGQHIGSGIAANVKRLVAPAIGAVLGAKALGSIKDFAKESVQSAGDLEQSVGAVDAVFKKQSAQIHKWAQGAASNVGLTTDAYNNFASILGSQLKNGGTAIDQIGAKTNDLITVGSDLSSMFGGTTTEAVEALSSALRGETDPIEKYGVSLNQAAVDAKAASMGFTKVGASLSTEANQAARLALIMEQTTDAHGNFSREATTLQGRQQRVSAWWGNITAKIGSGVLPAVSELTGVLLAAMPAVDGLADGFVKRAVPAASAFAARAIETTTKVVEAGKLLRTGDFTESFAKAFSVREDAPIVNALLTVRETAARVVGEVTGGIRAMGRAWREGGTDVTSSGFAGTLESIGLVARSVWDAVGPTVKELAPQILSLAAAFSPMGIALNGILPVLPVLGDALARIADAIGGVLSTALPIVGQGFADVGTALASGLAQALPSVVPLLDAVAASLPLLTPPLVTLVPAVTNLAVAALGLVTPLLANERLIKAVALGFVAWKAATAGLSLVSLVTGLGRSTLAWATNTRAVIANKTAMLASKAETVALAGMYTGQWIATQARTTAGWTRNTAALIANKTAALASSVASKAMAAGAAIVTGAQWALNAALNANPIGLIITAVVALIAGMVLLYKKNEGFRKVVDAVWAGIKKAISVVWTVLKVIFVSIATAVTILARAMTAFYQKNIAPVWNNIRGVIGVVWAWIRDKVFLAIRIYIEILKRYFKIYLAVVIFVWKAVKAIILGAWAVIKVIFNAIKVGISVVARGFDIARALIARAWSNVRGVIASGWAWIDRNALRPMRAGVGLVGAGFQVAREKVSGAWERTRAAIASGWSWIDDKVFGPLRTGVATIGTAFEAAQKVIAGAWDKVKSAVAKPVNFVLIDIYRDGIKKTWDDIAGKVGLSLRLPPVSPVAFAQGTEDHRAQIARPGAWRVWAEPETGGEAYIPLASSKRGRSTAILGQVARKFGYDLSPRYFADGGITGWLGDTWDSVTAKSKRAWDWLGDKAGSIAKFLSDPAGALGELIKAPVNALLARVPGGDTGRVLAELPRKAVTGLIDKVKSLASAKVETAAAATGGPVTAGSVMGYQSMSAWVRANLPGVAITSTYRPGATVAGTSIPSMHGMGRAVDLAPSMATFNKIDSAFGGRVTELIFSPAGNRQITRGRGGSRRGDTSGVTRSMHFNHVHWGMKNGGMIRGPGTATSDNILTPTSPGEFVVNAAATAKNLPLLQAINSGADFARAGSQVIAGLVAGVRSGLGQVVGAVREVAAATTSTFTDEMGIHSPSRVFRTLGAYLVRGLQVGITTSRESVVKTVTALTDRVTGAAEAGVKREADRLIAARRRTNDRIRAANKKAAAVRDRDLAAAARRRDQANAAADRLKTATARTAARKSAAAAYKAQTQAARTAYSKRAKATLPSLSRQDAERQARRNLATELAAASRARELLRAQASTTRGLWTKGAAAGTKNLIDSLTSAGGWRSRRNPAVKGSKAASARTKQATLADFARAREYVAARLVTEREKLKSLRESWTQMRDGVRDAIRGELDLAAGLGQDGKDTWGYTTSGTGGFASVAGTVKSLAAKAKTFATKLQALVKKGIPAGLVQEVAGMGTEKGIAVANALLSGTKAQVKTLAADYKALGSWSSKAGSYVADQMFAVGIRAQEGVVRGLVADDSKLAAAAKRLSDRVVAYTKKALGIRSPSRVMAAEVGRFLPPGVAVGIDDGQPVLDRRLARMVDARRVLVDPGRARINPDKVTNPAGGGVSENDLERLIGGVVEALTGLEVHTTMSMDDRQAAALWARGGTRLARTNPAAHRALIGARR